VNRPEPPAADAVVPPIQERPPPQTFTVWSSSPGESHHFEPKD